MKDYQTDYYKDVLIVYSIFSCFLENLLKYCQYCYQSHNICQLPNFL